MIAKVFQSNNCLFQSINGCDGILNSGRKPDQCGVCGGSCGKMKSGGPVFDIFHHFSRDIIEFG